MIGDQTLARRAINLLRPEARGRVNGLFTGLFFLGAAVDRARPASHGFVWAGPASARWALLSDASP